MSDEPSQSDLRSSVDAAPPGWWPAKVAELEAEVERLRDAATQAVLDALSWMDPETAAKWRAESSYKRLAEELRKARICAEALPGA